MPFSLSNILVIYIRIINNTLKDYLNRTYIMYLDNILVCSKII